MSFFNCEVTEITALTECVAKVVLKPEQPVEYVAGQYIELMLTDEDARAFSIANAPANTNEISLIELHVGAAENNDYTSAALAHFKQNKQVKLKGPSGTAGLKSQVVAPTILVAGGTGVSYTKAIAEAMLQKPLKAPLYFYWGVRDQAAAYDFSVWTAKQTELFKFIPVIEHPTAEWQGRTGNVIEAVLSDFDSLADYHIYSAGPFKMVGIARDQFIAQGMKKENMYADAFAYI